MYFFLNNKKKEKKSFNVIAFMAYVQGFCSVILLFNIFEKIGTMFGNKSLWRDMTRVLF